MTWRRRAASLVCFALAGSACDPLTDDVFTLTASPSAPSAAGSAPTGGALSILVSPSSVMEGAGVVELPLRLTAPAQERVTLAYRVVGDEAQSDCQFPDFEAADGQVEWPPGSTEARVRIWIGDDDLAERDERFHLELEPLQQLVSAPSSVEIVVLDDERSVLLDARELGVEPDAPGDQSAALQMVLDRAAELGRGVVLMAPGAYEVSSVSVPAGITLSAFGVTWRRPAGSPADTVTLRLQQQGAEDSAASLIEGLTLDGNREQQGPYRQHELESAHLVRAAGDAKLGGRARVTFERVRLTSGTGSGLFIGPSSELTVCELSASELWRDALTLNGGGSRLRLRGLDATASEGTGLWFGVREPGWDGSYSLDVEAEDVRVAAGDVEIEAVEGSMIRLRRLTMTEGPFRLDAPGGVVRIEDSILVIGLADALHNTWAQPHDVEISGSTLVVSESGVDPIEESAREFSAVSVTAQGFASGTSSAGAGHLLFTGCHFELARDVEADDTVYAIENGDSDARVEVFSSELGAGFADWFAPNCLGCALLQ